MRLQQILPCITLLTTIMITPAHAIDCSECSGVCSGGTCVCIANEMHFGFWAYDGSDTSNGQTFSITAGSSTPSAVGAGGSRFNNLNTDPEARMLVCVVDGVNGTNYYANILPFSAGAFTDNSNVGADVTLSNVQFTSHASGNVLQSSTCTYNGAGSCSWWITGDATINAGLANIDNQINNIGGPAEFSRDVHVELMQVTP